MKKLIKVKSAKYIKDYKIELIFNDNKKTTVDFLPFFKSSKHPDILKYLKVSVFKQFKIVNGDLDWNDFDLTFPITDLYENNILKNQADSDIAS
jgi:hypothetical protein